MGQLVVDASVAAKWFLAEEHSDRASQLRSSGDQLIAPDLLHIELANVINQWRRRSIISEPVASALAGGLSTLNIELAASLPLLPEAFRLAATYDRSIYDSLYIALALRERCQFVTADERLYNSIAGALPGTMLWVGDLPQNP